MANIELLPYAQQVAAIERQRKLASLMQEQGMQPSATQMVSGIAVPTSPWETASKLAQSLASAYSQSRSDKQEAALEKQQREEAKKSIQDFMAASGPQKGYESTPVMEQTSDEDRTEMGPKMQWSDETGQMEPVQSWKETLKPGLSRNEQIAKLLEMQAGGNKYVFAAVPTLIGMMPQQEEYGTPFESGGKMYAMTKQGTIKDLDLAAPTKEKALPSAVQEYEYAVRQGFKGTLADYEKQKAINVNVPAAETYGALTPVVDPNTGQTVYVRPGNKGSLQQVSGYKPVPTAPTESQTVSGTYASKVQDAEDVLGKYAAGSPYKPPSTKEQFKSDIPFVGNQLVDQDTQAYKTAERSFIEAWLRKTSGAAISASEYDQARKQYIPQPGDTDAVLEQKRKSRQRVLQGMVRGAGASYQSDASSIPDGFIEVSP